MSKAPQTGGRSSWALVLSTLSLLAAVLIAAAALQVWFGLQPMARLRGALGAIGSGKAAKLPDDFPSEVQPLVDDLNNLIEVNAQIVLRARTQAGNLAHALKTPLAILADEAHRLSSSGQAHSATWGRLSPITRAAQPANTRPMPATTLKGMPNGTGRSGLFWCRLRK